MSDQRAIFSCCCGCGKSATLPHFQIVADDEDRFPVLPPHIDAFKERLAASKKLIEMVADRRPWRHRFFRALEVFRLQMTIRNNRPLAMRSATLFALPKWAGLRLARVWR